MQIWAHGRQYPESTDYWDVNWLNVTAHCGGEGSDVWVTGPIIHITELKALREDLTKLSISLKGSVILDTMEPNFRIEFEATSKKEIQVKVHLTPNHLSQGHKYFFEVSQDNLNTFVQELKGILENYPIAGNP